MPEPTTDKSARDGIVYLVGAGPGDPGLLTLRGKDLLAAADVVIYDALANPELLQHAPTAQVIYVGKKAAAHAVSQDQINAMLIEHARRGRRIVRLKGGDPFIFGRGGEECEALAAAGIRFEVTPGITAAIAAPAYAGIPVTHRDLNSSFTFITGHEKEEEYRDPQAAQHALAAGSSDIDWASIARLPCIAFYMGVKSLPRICQRLIEHGKDPLTAAAIIQWGTTPRQRTIVGTLADLAEKAAGARIAPPATIVVGRVVELRGVMNWFEGRPLFGRKIIVTRTRQQASELSSRLSELGAQVIEAPMIELRPATNPAAVDEALLSAASFDWIVFTSQNGVGFARRRLFEIGRDVRTFGQAGIAAIGAATASAIASQLCLRVDLQPDRFVAEALADELIRRGQVAGKRFLLLRADIARPLLRQRLIDAGAAEVRDVAMYETVPAASLPQELLDALAGSEVDWATFTSSSTAKNFAELLGPDYRQRLGKVRIASIGPVTTDTLAALGLAPTVEAETYTVEGLIAALLAVRTK